MHGALDFTQFPWIPHELGWEFEIHEPPLFLGHRLKLDVGTRRFEVGLHGRQPMPPPAISDLQAHLGQRILVNLGAIIREAERALEKWHGDFERDFQKMVCDPSIWIDFDSDGEAWAFVVHRVDNPDFGYHIEFKGLELIAIWAGD